MKTSSSLRYPRWMQIVVAIAMTECVGLLGSVFTMSAIPLWYATLVRPSFAPPNWIFGPVWTALFAMMGVAAFLVWEQRGKRKGVRRALDVFGVQLALNVLWSVLFFGMQNPGAAFVEILALWFAILLTIVMFAKISRTAAWLLAPYLLWVSFATVLNYAFWMLN